MLIVAQFLGAILGKMVALVGQLKCLLKDTLGGFGLGKRTPAPSQLEAEKLGAQKLEREQQEQLGAEYSILTIFEKGPAKGEYLKAAVEAEILGLIPMLPEDKKEHYRNEAKTKKYIS